METKDILEALDRIEGKMRETSESLIAEMQRLGDEQLKLSRKLLEIQQTGVKLEKPAQQKSVGAICVEAENFKAFRDGSSQKARIELKEGTDTTETTTDTTTITTPTGGIVQAYRRPGVLPGAFRPLTIEGLFPSLPIATTAFEYVQEKSYTNGAAFVEEAAQKPFGRTDFEAKTGTIKTIAHLARISKQLMADAPALVAYINLRLIYGLDLVVEDQLVTGDGSGQKLSGILNTGNFTPHGVTKLADLSASPTLFDLILKAKAKVEQAFFRPNLVLMSPSDWTSLQMLKRTTGEYYLGHPASVAPKSLWGLPVWTTPAVTTGKFLVGDFNQAATLYRRQGMTVELFEQDADNVQKNLVTIRAERRLGFSVERSAALCGGALALPTT